MEITGEPSNPSGRSGDRDGRGMTMPVGAQMVTATRAAGLSVTATGAPRFDPGEAGSTKVGEDGGVRLSRERRLEACGEAWRTGLHTLASGAARMASLGAARMVSGVSRTGARGGSPAQHPPPERSRERSCPSSRWRSHGLRERERPK